MSYPAQAWDLAQSLRHHHRQNLVHIACGLVRSRQTPARNLRIISNIKHVRGGSQITFASLGGWVVQNLEKLQTL